MTVMALATTAWSQTFSVPNASVTAADFMAVDSVGDKLYVGAGGNGTTYCYNGTTWTTLPAENVNPMLRGKMACMGGNMYVIGTSPSPQYLPMMKKWNGTTISANIPYWFSTEKLYDICMFNNKLYITSTMGICSYDGSTYATIANSSANTANYPYKLYTDGSFLYFSVFNKDTLNGIAIDYVGKISTSGTITAMPYTIGYGTAVTTIRKFNGRTMVAGDIRTSTGSPYSCVAMDSSGQTAYRYFHSQDFFSCSMTYNYKAYFSDQSYGLKTWDGYTWSTMPSMGGSSGDIKEMAVYHGDLYIGGNFLMPASMTTPQKFIKYNESSVTSIQEANQPDFSIYPNPTTGEVFMPYSSLISVYGLDGRLVKTTFGSKLEMGEPGTYVVIYGNKKTLLTVIR